MKRGSREDEDEVAEQQQVPEENDDVFFLRAECRRRGISAGGSVALLKDRIRRHRTGEGAVLLKKPRNLAVFQPGEEGARTVIDHVAQEPRHYSGTDTLLGLPHEILKRKVIPFVGTLELFALARTCKYLHNDCLQELVSRAKSVFGKNASTSTPMALNLLLKLQNTAENVALVTGYKETEDERRTRALKTMGLEPRDYKVGRMPFIPDEVRKMREHCRNVGIISYPEYAAVCIGIREKKSVEQALLTKVFATAQEEAKRSEALVVASMKRQRVAEMSRAMFDANGGEELFLLSPDGASVDLSPKGKMVFDMFGIAKYKQCTSFILKAAPSTTTVLTNLYKEYDAFKAYSANTLRRKAINRVLEAAFRRVDDDPRCVQRLSVWLAACFSLHPTFHGAFTDSHLARLSSEYIESLVDFIADTADLPVEQNVLHPDNNDTIRAFVLFPECVSHPAEYRTVDCTSLSADAFPKIPYAEHMFSAGYYTMRYWAKSDNRPLGVFCVAGGSGWAGDTYTWRGWYGSTYRVEKWQDTGCMPLVLKCGGDNGTPHEVMKELLYF